MSRKRGETWGTPPQQVSPLCRRWRFRFGRDDRLLRERTSAAEAGESNEPLTAALKALRHPKSVAIGTRALPCFESISCLWSEVRESGENPMSRKGGETWGTRACLPNRLRWKSKPTSKAADGGARPT